MKAFSAAGRRTAGVDRRLLKLGTVLGSGAAAAALLIPAAAFASTAPAQPGWGEAQLALLQPVAFWIVVQLCPAAIMPAIPALRSVSSARPLYLPSALALACPCA